MIQRHRASLLIIALLMLGLGFLGGASYRAWVQAKSPISPTTHPPGGEGTDTNQGGKNSTNTDNAKITALFSPEDNIQKTLVNTLDHAKRNILVQAYILTDERIAAALIRAHQRGVDVQILLDNGMVAEARKNLAPDLYAAGIPVYLETNYEIAHNKVIIIDHDTQDALVITGSYNFTYSAQYRNAENIVIIRQSPTVIRRYVRNWQDHASQAIPYGGNPIS